MSARATRSAHIWRDSFASSACTSGRTRRARLRAAGVRWCAPPSAALIEGCGEPAPTSTSSKKLMVCVRESSTFSYLVQRAMRSEPNETEAGGLLLRTWPGTFAHHHTLAKSGVQ